VEQNEVIVDCGLIVQHSRSVAMKDTAICFYYRYSQSKAIGVAADTACAVPALKRATAGICSCMTDFNLGYPYFAMADSQISERARRQLRLVLTVQPRLKKVSVGAHCKYCQ